jgi:hypothetical protein
VGHPLSRLNRSAAGDAEVTDEAQAESDLENRLAVLTNWSFWGSFGTCFVMSGFAESRYLIGLAGFALIAVAFVSHLIINRMYGTSFRNGEITTAVSAFGVALLAFILAWIVSPDMDRSRVWLGLTGAALGVGGTFTYLAARFGLVNSFSMFHIKSRP